MAWRELWLPSDVELKRLLKVSLHVLAVSMRARDCCMRECRWMCNYYIGGGGRCGLASVHGCTLACMYALLHAGCRTGGLVRTCVCRISKCIARISQCISRAGHAMVPPHSTGLRLAVGWGSDKEHKAHGFMAMRDRWIGRCSSNGGITYCRDDKSAGTA